MALDAAFLQSLGQEIYYSQRTYLCVAISKFSSSGLLHHTVERVNRKRERDAASTEYYVFHELYLNILLLLFRESGYLVAVSVRVSSDAVSSISGGAWSGPIWDILLRKVLARSTLRICSCKPASVDNVILIVGTIVTELVIWVAFIWTLFFVAVNLVPYMIPETAAAGTTVTSAATALALLEYALLVISQLHILVFSRVSSCRFRAPGDRSRHHQLQGAMVLHGNARER